MGCDNEMFGLVIKVRLFQSTHPSWGATVTALMMLRVSIFQSTHPSWGATVQVIGLWIIITISIHAPIVGCDFIHT